MAVEGFAPSQPGQTFGSFIVLSTGTGIPVEVNGRVVAKGSVLYNWKTGRTQVVSGPISEIAPANPPRRFSFFKTGTPSDRPNIPQIPKGPKRRGFRIF